ncbi:sesquipedalian-1 isoform X1 [Bactrocera neohumeralis]|uniref:sesquipedalian-1 isoform X1 n=1 Tax=Bactrocera neohumeralis TaxID=98809 RepID=UPI0021668D35|nr:sesquipedalian-1 isoform X1 [Bactrocera neohumeralis]
MKINEKNLCVFATSPPFDCEGFLNKRGEINKAFQRRYFVLKGNLLFYFEKKGDKEPLGLIIVEGCTIELSEESDQYCFEIAFNGNRTYILSADSQEIMENWMKALTCAGYEYKKLVVAELQRQLEEIEFSRNNCWPLENGIPQGSPLSVTLFLVAFDRLSRVINENKFFKHVFYADDLCKYGRVKNVTVFQTEFNNLLVEIINWCNASGAKISIAKSNHLHICNKHTCQSFTLNLGDTYKKNVTTLKILGIFFNKKYNWNDHMLIYKNHYKVDSI